VAINTRLVCVLNLFGTGWGQLNTVLSLGFFNGGELLESNAAIMRLRTRCMLQGGGRFSRIRKIKNMSNLRFEPLRLRRIISKVGTVFEGYGPTRCYSRVYLCGI
jgi:hypothetical protein